jgi:hypothetical protein
MKEKLIKFAFSQQNAQFKQNPMFLKILFKKSPEKLEFGKNLVFLVQKLTCHRNFRHKVLIWRIKSKKSEKSVPRSRLCYQFKRYKSSCPFDILKYQYVHFCHFFLQ